MPSSTTNNNKYKCAVCQKPALKRCNQCKSIWYCSRNCQVSDWKSHKAQCKIIAADIARADSYTIHKREFDRIRTHYKLDSPSQAEKIAELLSNSSVANNGEKGVSAPDFAKMFGMRTEEAVVFLEWIKVGVKFKEETLDTAKKAGLG
eukprot:CAMPEP_0201647910 /NCGR_PEP_ID=MMETSP0493-20130528/36658_1 /ASSEMBLY_ACC=CAM_ASM_000838 /TAXON_ID=420259 /ORGANISM="Thalassiosira gravida, Strain GMp14c1" /LENGTH=147 /DNA_ID=CAMNT_0048123429 /DNA_START=30 /DNA_END=473 /DNA_ORIENTATION=-